VTTIRSAFGFVAALALGLGVAAIAQAQHALFCSAYPCYQVNVDTTDGAGVVTLFNESPFNSLQLGSNVNGNHQEAYGIAQFGSVGASTGTTVVACPTNCLVTVQANSGGFYWDIFDLSGLGLVAGDMLQFSMSLHGSFGSGPGTVGFGYVDASIVLLNGNNEGFADLNGNNFFPPQQSTLTATVVVDPTVDRYVQLVLGVLTGTALSPSLGDFGSNLSEFSTTFTIDDVALLDPSGEFVRDIVLTDTAGFILPGPGPVQTVPEPATVLLVASALAALGTRRAGRRPTRPRDFPRARKEESQVARARNGLSARLASP
jgi:hypothetical protein